MSKMVINNVGFLTNNKSGILQAIPISVIILGKIRWLNIIISTQELSCQRIINPPVHIDHIEPRKMFMTYKASTCIK